MYRVNRPDTGLHLAITSVLHKSLAKQVPSTQDTMGQRMARRLRRLWTDEEKRSICFQTTVAGVSVAQVARRYAMNANMIFKWLRDPRYAPDPEAVEDLGDDASCFLPVEIVDRPRNEDTAPAPNAKSAHSAIEIDTAGGHRLRIIGGYDPEALARLIRGLSA